MNWKKKIKIGLTSISCLILVLSQKARGQESKENSTLLRKRDTTTIILKPYDTKYQKIIDSFNSLIAMVTEQLPPPPLDSIRSIFNHDYHLRSKGIIPKKMLPFFPNLNQLNGTYNNFKQTTYCDNTGSETIDYYTVVYKDTLNKNVEWFNFYDFKSKTITTFSKINTRLGYSAIRDMRDSFYKELIVYYHKNTPIQLTLITEPKMNISKLIIEIDREDYHTANFTCRGRTYPYDEIYIEIMKAKNYKRLRKYILGTPIQFK